MLFLHVWPKCIESVRPKMMMMMVVIMMIMMTMHCFWNSEGMLLDYETLRRCKLTGRVKHPSVVV